MIVEPPKHKNAPVSVPVSHKDASCIAADAFSELVRSRRNPADLDSKLPATECPSPHPPSNDNTRVTGEIGRLLKRKPGIACRRRSFLAGLGALLAAELMPSPSAATSSAVIDVTSPPYNANPNSADNYEAFSEALTALEALGGGCLLVPPGRFQIRAGLSWQSQAPLSIVGFGAGLSIIVAEHTQTVLACNFGAARENQFFLRDIGFSPATNGILAGLALSLNFPALNVSGWQSCHVENVDFGVSSPNYTAFSAGIQVKNAWRSVFSNINCHSNLAGGGTVAIIGGTLSVDNFFDRCYSDGMLYGILVDGYCQGLHITDSVIIAQAGFSSGQTPYYKGGDSGPYINILGLYIDNCEFNTEQIAAVFYCISTGWISNTHFGSNAKLFGSSVLITGCNGMQFTNCSATGDFPATQSAYTGFYLQSAVNGTWASFENSFDSTVITNATTGIVLAPGCMNNTITRLRMEAPGNGSAIGAPVKYGNFTLQAVVDDSGNSTNLNEWIASDTSANDSTNRYLYEPSYPPNARLRR